MVLLSDSYIAIIGDIKDSKKIEKRIDVQKRLHQILNEINNNYSDDIASRLEITLGDEFQGLLKNGRNVMNIITNIEINLYPVKLRYGIGIGDITTDINPNFPLGSDGPAYYNAREALDYLKKNEKKRKTSAADIRISSNSQEDNEINLLNAILSLNSVIKSKWTNRQREIIYDYINHQDNQISVANRLGITQSSVQKGLSGGAYYSYEAAIREVTQILAKIRRENV